MRRIPDGAVVAALRQVVVLGMAVALGSGFGCGGGGGGGGGKKKKADLEIVSFSHTTAGTSVTYTVTIRNGGKKDAAAVRVDVYYDLGSPPTVGLSGDQTQLVPMLATGASQTLMFTRSPTPPGNYLSHAQVDSLDAVDESDETNNVAGPNPVTVVPPAGIDLAVTSFTSSVLGSDVTYDVEVTNLGNTATTGAFDVELFYDSPTAPAVGPAGDDTMTIGPLGAGMGQNLVFNRNGAPNGSYLSWVVVDSMDTEAETDETNNVSGPEAVSVGSTEPDLLITGFNPVVSGSTVTYTVEVTNSGVMDSGPFSVDLYYDRIVSPMVGDPGDDANVLPGIIAGGSQMLSFVRMATPAGTYDSYVQADTFDAVLEGNENNNIAGPASVLVSTPPDLVITAFTALVAGSTVNYTATVENQGLSDSGGFSVDLYYDRGSAPSVGLAGDDAQVLSGGLGAGMTMNLNFSRSSTPAGTYDSYLQVDTFDAVGETNEGNNVAGPETHTVAGSGMPDLVISGITHQVIGPDVEYTVTVTNQGTADAGFFAVDLYYDRATAPSAQIPGDDEMILSSLAMGASMPLVFTRASAPMGTYNSWAYADVFESVLESDENNTAGGPEVVVVP